MVVVEEPVSISRGDGEEERDRRRAAAGRELDADFAVRPGPLHGSHLDLEGLLLRGDGMGWWRRGGAPGGHRRLGKEEGILVDAGGSDRGGSRGW